MCNFNFNCCCAAVVLHLGLPSVEHACQLVQQHLQSSSTVCTDAWSAMMPCRREQYSAWSILNMVLPST